MSKIIEQWKKVDGFNGIYEVSDWGNVRSIDHYANSKSGNKVHFYKGKIKNQTKTESGYSIVGLYKGKSPWPARVHVLVALAFVENDDPINKTQVNHIDENKDNNCAWNLEWCTPKYNCNYGNRTEKIMDKKRKPVVGRNSDGEIVCRFGSAKEAEQYGYSNEHICSCCKGKRKRHKGLYWNYEE